MLTKTPFLTGFSTLLCGRAKRSKQELIQKQSADARDQSLDGLSRQLATEISAETLLANSDLKRRNRVYTDIVTFWAFLAQVISADSSCAKAVARVQQWMRRVKRKIPSSATGHYTEARAKLPIETLREVNRSLCAQLDANLPEANRWRGHKVKSEDGTSAQAPDTPANQAQYPQPKSQAEGCGFPVIQLVGLIDLGHGGLHDFAHSDVEAGELRGHDQLEDGLEEGDVLVADRLYSSYEVITRLQQRGIEFIGRNHHARKCDFRRGRKLGSNQRLQVWQKPRQQPKQSRLSPEQWSTLPESIAMRIIRVKGPDREGKSKTRYVVTTLVDVEKYPWEEIASLYMHRWEIELRFRDIKTTMGMEMLRTQTPEMVRKEVLMHMIAYNAMRLLMLKAAMVAGVTHRRISFKGTLQVIEETRIGFETNSNHPRLLEAEKDNLLERIAERIIPYRPGRNEPRKKKRRPKSYGWLQKPRHDFFEHFTNPDPPRKILDEMS
jgi:hypothetical protein